MTRQQTDYICERCGQPAKHLHAGYCLKCDEMELDGPYHDDSQTQQEKDE